MSVAVAVFVKTPGHSPIKTRLARTLGDDLAIECHRRAAAAVAQVLERPALRGAIAPYWAVAETSALAAGAWQGFASIGQGEGGLGERMARVHRALVVEHGAAILIGADAPQVEASHLARAADWLQAPPPRMALGPARDGGFWLFGANRIIEPTRWNAVTYSREDTATRFRAAVDSAAAWIELPLLTDLDRGEDLGQVAEELALIADPCPAQRELALWLRGIGAARADATR